VDPDLDYGLPKLAKSANMRGRKNISKNSKWSQKTKVNVDFETVEQKLKSKITKYFPKNEF
jgi:hypothetical protein